MRPVDESNAPDGASLQVRMTFDRYLLRSFLHIFVSCFITFYGLVVVIDLLENVDEFLANKGTGGVGSVLLAMLQYYSVQGIFFLDRAGPSLTVIAAMVVLILFQRSGELHPMLSAGVPMYRILAPLPVATALVTMLLVANREMVVPHFAYAAMQERGAKPAGQRVESVYDHSTRISIDGARLELAERSVESAEFVLPAPSLAKELTILKARTAKFYPARGGRPAGWVLTEATPPFHELSLTAEGARLVKLLPGKTPRLFVATAVSCDQLYKRNSSYSLLSTAEILERIHCPAYGSMSVHRLTLHLHQRLVQPLLNVIAVLLAIPLLVRRESTGLVADAAWCTGIQGILFGVVQVSQFLGLEHWLAPDVAAWLPVVTGAALAASIYGKIRT